MRDQEWDSALAQLHSLNLSELVFCLFGLDSVNGEATLGIIDKSEVLPSFLNADNIHETGWVCCISSDFAIHLDQTLHNDSLGLARVQGILETISDEDDQWHAVAKLVRTGRRAGSVGTRQFIEEPMRWRAQALLMLLSVDTDRVSP